MSAGDDFWNRGNDAADRGDHALAAALFRQAIAVGLPLELNLGNSLNELGDIDGALEAYSTGWEAGDLDTGFNLAVLLEGVDANRARTIYRRLVAADYAKANINLAWIERERGNQSRAEELLEQVKDNDDESGATASAILGVWYGMQGRPDDITRPLLERDPDYPDARSDLASITLRAEGETAAIEILEVGAARGEAQSLIVLGNIHWDAGRFEEARKAYQAGAVAGDKNSAENLASLEREVGLTSH